jgi:transposase
MRAGINVEVTPEDRRRLDRIVGDRNSPQKHAARARVILATADGCGTVEVVRRSGLSKPVVWRWQERFMHEGVDGLLRDKTRPPGKASLPADVIKRIVDLTLAEPSGETTHWTGRAMAKVAGVSLRSVQRVWTTHGLAPHRVRTFKLSNDKRFVEKFADARFTKRRLKRGVFRSITDLQPPSIASSMNTTKSQSPSSGKPIQSVSSPLSNVGSKR